MLTIDELVTSLQAQKRLLQAAPLSNGLATFSGQATAIPTYVQTMLHSFVNFRVLHLSDRRHPIGSEEANRLLRLKMSRGGGATLKSIQQTVDSLLGVEIDAFVSPEPPTQVQNRPTTSDAELDVGNFLVQVNGSGVREALRLILDLEFGRPHIVLVEEPEIHLHPALEIAMMRHLKSMSNTTQVFLTTHSTNFLDTGDMRNVYMVRNSGETEIRHLNVDDVESELPKELGIRLSSVFMFDRLVFVEGISDELVLRAFAQSLGVNLGQSNVGFVIMGGARNFTHYAAQGTLAVLAKRKVKSTFVLDKDERDDGQIKNFADKLNGQADLHVLQRREIENYLVDPHALAEFIQQKAWLGDRRVIVPTVDEINGALDEIAEDLRETSVVKRVAGRLCGVHRVDRNTFLEAIANSGLQAAAETAVSELEVAVAQLRAEIVQHVADAEREVEAGWSVNKLELVPGHELLDNLMKRYNLRFNKDRDCGELASLMNSQLIPAELHELLRNITGELGDSSRGL